MKIFDASPLIAIFNNIKRPDVFDDILKLGDELVIPMFVWEELKDSNTEKRGQIDQRSQVQMFGEKHT